MPPPGLNTKEDHRGIQQAQIGGSRKAEGADHPGRKEGIVVEIITKAGRTHNKK